tara:strand:- start:2801 stop:3025 length:225 start_codon:yes stop_codon:yes gene_type:complete
MISRNAGINSAFLKEVEISTDADGVVQDPRLKNRTWIAVDEGFVSNNAPGAVIDKNAGSLDTGIDGIRTIKFFM